MLNASCESTFERLVNSHAFVMHNQLFRKYICLLVSYFQFIYKDFIVWLTMEVQWRGNAVVAQCWCVIHSTVFGKFIHVIGRVYDRHSLLLISEQMLFLLLVPFVFWCLFSLIFGGRVLGHFLLFYISQISNLTNQKCWVLESNANILKLYER